MYSVFLWGLIGLGYFSSFIINVFRVKVNNTARKLYYYDDYDYYSTFNYSDNRTITWLV